MYVENAKVYQIINGKEIEVESFNTDSYGEFKFIAKINNISSNMLIVKANSENDNPYYSTNRTGFGINKTITIDGEISDWDKLMKIAQGIANDDPRIFNGAHEGPVFDLYALYAAWDNYNLYLMWQFTNVNDITNSDNGYPNSDNAKPWNTNMPQLFAFDVFADKGSDGILEGQEISIFKTSISFANKEVDYMVAFNSKPSFLYGSAVYSLNDSGYFQPHETGKDWSVIVSESPYEQRFHDNLDIQFAFGDQFLGENIFGVNCKGGNYNGEHWGDTPEVLNDLDRYVDFLTLGHNIEMETFYEMKIPLNLLGIDKNYIETNGIGVMAISTFGTSATATLPHDPSVLDNAMVPYSEDDSTSAEKEDHDEITVPFARIGK